MGPRIPGLAQAGAQQGGDTLCVLSPVAVDDDGVQSPETVTLQQSHQRLWGQGLLQRAGRQGRCQALARTLTWSGSLSEDTERCRLAGMVAGPLSTDSSVTPRCQATSRAVLRVAVAVRPRKQWTPIWSRSVCEGAVSQLCLPAPPLYIALPAQAHLTDTQVTGPEVVGPLREAVGLIEAGKGDRRQLREEGAGPGPNHCLWGQHQHLHAGRTSLRRPTGQQRHPAPPTAPPVWPWEATSPSAGQSPAASWSSPSECRPPSSQGAGQRAAGTGAQPVAWPWPFPKALPGWFYLTTTAGSPPGPLGRRGQSRPWALTEAHWGQIPVGLLLPSCSSGGWDWV